MTVFPDQPGVTAALSIYYYTTVMAADWFWSGPRFVLSSSHHVQETTMRNGISGLLILLIAAVPFAYAGDQKVPLDKLPEEVVKAVTSKFPKAKMESAVKATADGKTSYEVTLKAGKFGIDVTVTSEGKIVQVEKEMAFADLPKPVAAAFNARYPKGKVKRIEELSKEDRIISYEFLIEAAEKTLEGYFDPQGKFLQEKDVTPKKAEKGQVSHHFV
jgi:Putative beta-lactamase-inhibitor-like, PepSY-like